MDEQLRRADQLRLLAECLARPDLTRGQIVIFSDMRVAVAEKGLILSDANENWLREVKSRPFPVVGPASVRVDELAAWRPMGKKQVVAWSGAVVVALVVFEEILTFVLHRLGWR